MADNRDRNNNAFALVFKKQNTGSYIYYRSGKMLLDKLSNKYYYTDDKVCITMDEFDIFKGNPNFLNSEYEELSLEHSDDIEKNFGLYIVSDDYINNIRMWHGYNYSKACNYITECAKKIKIIKNEDTYISISNKKYDNKEDNTELMDSIHKSNPYGLIIVLNGLLSNEQKEQLANYYSNDNKKNIINDIDIEKIIEEISHKIVGQEETIKTLVTNIYINQLLIDSLKITTEEVTANELDSRRQSILIDGSTGTGKTAILKEISKKMGIPLVIANANSFSETGYVGPSITDLLDDLLDQSKGDIALAQRGIVVLDEIDKIAETDYESRSMKLGVQKELLGFISGSKYELKNESKIMSSSIEFDTSKLTFILSGAFTSIKDNKIKANNRNKLGFGNSEEKKNTYKVDVQDYIDYGLMREFFGRIKVLTYTKTYTKEDLKNILLNSTISPLKGLEKTCIMFDYPGIEYDDEFIDYICSKAYDMSTGARALQTLISGIQDLLLMDLINGTFDKNNKIKLRIEMLDEYNKRNERTY